MNNEFEPIPGSLPPEGPANKKIEEIIYPERSEEVDGDKWTPSQQPPINTSPSEINISPQTKQDIADVTNKIAQGLVGDDLNNLGPQETKVPGRIISETENNKPEEIDIIGGFGDLERRSFEGSIEQQEYDNTSPKPDDTINDLVDPNPPENLGNFPPKTDQL